MAPRPDPELRENKGRREGFYARTCSVRRSEAAGYRDNRNEVRSMDSEEKNTAPTPEELAEMTRQLNIRFREAIQNLAKPEQLLAIEWLHRSVNGDETERGLLAGIISGDFIIARIDNDGEPHFKLTPQGNETALHALHKSQEHRDLWQALSGKAMVKPPNEVQ
jgi:hypothetical protein